MPTAATTDLFSFFWPIGNVMLGLIEDSASVSVMLLAISSSQTASTAAALRQDKVAFREIYEELVETNTTFSSGSCTEVAERMAARLKASGIPDSQLTLFSLPEHPKEGGLVAIYPGTSKRLFGKSDLRDSVWL